MEENVITWREKFVLSFLCSSRKHEERDKMFLKVVVELSFLTFVKGISIPLHYITTATSATENAHSFSCHFVDQI